MVKVDIKDKKSYEEWLTHTLPVVMLFSSKDCATCHAVENVVGQKLFTKDFIFGKVDVLDQDDLVYEAGVTTLPTTILYHEGREVSRRTGSNILRLLEMLEGNI
jgi:thioredoxin-like negative regulator of GroEL